MKFYIYLSIFLSSCCMVSFYAKSSHHTAEGQKTALSSFNKAYQSDLIWRWPTNKVPNYIISSDPRPTNIAKQKVERIDPPIEHAKSVQASRSRTRHSQGTVSNASIEACIVAREHGGSYTRGNNPTHTGKYQISYSLWISHGGNPDTWNNASPEEQEQVFRNIVNANGYNDWRPYDGC